jgi:type II pantothenate kinase
VGGGSSSSSSSSIPLSPSFEELLELAARGDARKCDMMVGDIYGHDYQKIGLSADVVASSFGKAAGPGDDDARPEDRARALLMMVTNNIAQVPPPPRISVFRKLILLK